MSHLTSFALLFDGDFVSCWGASGTMQVCVCNMSPVRILCCFVGVQATMEANLATGGGLLAVVVHLRALVATHAPVPPVISQYCVPHYLY
jgi:hypothetical protein